MMFSVIIPLYNKEKYICRAIQSVVAQSYHEWELIVVNDGSTDKSYEVAYECLHRNSDVRIKLINQTNMGVSAARNRGITESCGEHICFLDADDWWHEDFLKEVYRLIKNANYSNIGIYVTNYYCVKYQNNKLGVTYIDWKLKDPKLNYGIIDYWSSYLYTDGGMPITSITVCIPRFVIKKLINVNNEFFPIGISMGEDFLVWSKIALKYNICFLDVPLAFYNFDSDKSGRAINKLHKPSAHMLFNMDFLDCAAMENESIAQLLNKLRAKGLYPYWISNLYNDDVRNELKKINWKQVPKKYQYLYKCPMPILSIYEKIMALGCKCKRFIRKKL